MLYRVPSSLINQLFSLSQVLANWIILEDPEHRAALKAELAAVRVPARRVIIADGGSSVFGGGAPPNGLQ